jgi:hypothetical protein
MSKHSLHVRPISSPVSQVTHQGHHIDLTGLNYLSSSNELRPLTEVRDRRE